MLITIKQTFNLQGGLIALARKMLCKKSAKNRIWTYFLIIDQSWRRRRLRASKDLTDNKPEQLTFHSYHKVLKFFFQWSLNVCSLTLVVSANGISNNYTVWIKVISLLMSCICSLSAKICTNFIMTLLTQWREINGRNNVKCQLHCRERG